MVLAPQTALFDRWTPLSMYEEKNTDKKCRAGEIRRGMTHSSCHGQGGGAPTRVSVPGDAVGYSTRKIGVAFLKEKGDAGHAACPTYHIDDLDRRHLAEICMKTVTARATTRRRSADHGSDDGKRVSRFEMEQENPPAMTQFAESARTFGVKDFATSVRVIR